MADERATPLNQGTNKWLQVTSQGELQTWDGNTTNFYEEGTAEIREPTPETGEFDDYAVRRFICLYTRLGEIVHVTVNHRSNAVTLGTASGVLIYSGLPFLVDDIQTDDIIVAMNLDPSNYTNPPVSAELLAGTNTFRLRKANGNLFTAEDLLATGSGTNQNRVRFSIMYRIG